MDIPSEKSSDQLSSQVHYRLVEALSTSENRYKSLVDQLSEIVLVLDNGGQIKFLNQAWHCHMGYMVEECLGKSIYEYIVTADLAQAAQCFRADESKCFEIRLVDAEQNILYFETTATGKIDRHNQNEIFCTLINMTGRVKAALALQESNERFILAATAANDGIWDWNILTGAVYLSPRWKEMLGYSDDELANSYATWADRVHPDDRQKTFEILENCVAGDEAIYEHVHRLKNKAGEWQWILDRGVILRNKDGVVARMAGSHTDITQLRHMEAQLEQRNDELNTLFNMNPDGIVTFDFNGRISSINPAFLEMTGFLQAEFEQLLRDDFIEKLNTITVSGKAFKFNDAFLYIYPKAEHSVLGQANDSKIRVLKITVRTVKSALIKKILYFRDVTAEMEIDRMKSDFLSMAAHELRTPMSSVYGFTELLMTREFDTATRQQLLKNIHSQAESLVAMVNDLLDLAKIEARANHAFHMELQPLEPIVQEVVDGFMLSGDQRKIHLAFVGTWHQVSLDAEHIKRALTNIISNAFKYSPQGGDVEVRVISQTTETTPRVGVMVKDNGIGMTSEQISHLYDRFWRGENVSDIPGTGLGMALVKEIMDFHQGTIEVNSQANMGTSVTLWFDCKPVKQ